VGLTGIQSTSLVFGKMKNKLVRIFRTSEVLKNLEKCIVEKLPFSLIRFGDGGIKLLHALFHNDQEQLASISFKEGIPLEMMIDVVELWGKYARQADYIDTPEVYFLDNFWIRYRKGTKKATKKTVERMGMWRELYHSAEFDNDSYCNPEINYIACVNSKKRRNLLSIIEGRKICLITACVNARLKLYKYSVDVVPIVGQYSKHYEISYEKVVGYIEQNYDKYDLWLVAAGELGRIYSGMIKEKGGRAFDIGFVVDFWHNGFVPHRLEMFMRRNPKNFLELVFTPLGERFDKYL